MQSSLSPIRRIAPQMAYVLNEPVILGQPVDAVVTLAHPPDRPADGVRLERARHPPCRLVHVGEVDLDACVVLGGQDPVGGGTLPGDVHVNILSSFVLHGGSKEFPSLVEVNQAIK